MSIVTCAFCKGTGRDPSMKKHNIVINILFWILVPFIISIITLLLVIPNGNINSLIFGGKEEIAKETIRREPIKREPLVTVITEFIKVEKEVEWYYFVATGYSADDPVQGTNNITATGVEVYEGIIAVDPKVIPLKTNIEIKGMGTFMAEDTGGKIKGNRIDIFFDLKEEAKKFGRRGVWIRILDNNAELEN